ncbi:MAG: hypothetical protein KAW49_03995 [Anaerolineae bacterium]|nr:hypothetical protein [Anaerolineae bacterium]
MRRHLPSTSEAAAPLIELAIAEDIGPGDATSEATLAADAILHGCIIAKASGVIAGLPVAAAVFRRVDPAINVVAQVDDGVCMVLPGPLPGSVKVLWEPAAPAFRRS